MPRVADTVQSSSFVGQAGRTQDDIQEGDQEIRDDDPHTLPWEI